LISDAQQDARTTNLNIWDAPLYIQTKQFLSSIFLSTQNTIKTSGKMTLTFNSEAYAQLLAKYQPKLITNDEENEQAILIAEELAHKTIVQGKNQPYMNC